MATRWLKGIERIDLGGAVGLTITVAGVTDNRMDRRAAADRLIVGHGNDRVIGCAGNDVLEGGNGEDSLQGGLSDDTLYGGAGLDTASFAAATGALVINLNAGTATVEGTDRLFKIERVLGRNSNDTLTGNAGANVLVGNGGGDTFSGGAGADTYYDGAGNEFFRIDDAGDLAFGTGTGIDRAQVFFNRHTVIEGIERIDVRAAVDP